jgi:hypothetical protein
MINSAITRYNKAEKAYQGFIKALGLPYIESNPKALAQLQRLADELETAGNCIREGKR